MFWDLEYGEGGGSLTLEHAALRMVQRHSHETPADDFSIEAQHIHLVTGVILMWRRS